MDPDLFNTVQASDYIATKTGHRPSENTLKKLRCVGGGPQFRTWGRFVVYPRDALDAWISERLSQRKRSTSDVASRPTGSSVSEAAGARAA